MHLVYEKSPNGFYIINIGDRKYCWEIDDNKFSDMTSDENTIEIIHNRYGMAMVSVVNYDEHREILRQEINPLHAASVDEWVVDDQM